MIWTYWTQVLISSYFALLAATLVLFILTRALQSVANRSSSSDVSQRLTILNEDFSQHEATEWSFTDRQRGKQIGYRFSKLGNAFYYMLVACLILPHFLMATFSLASYNKFDPLELQNPGKFIWQSTAQPFFLTVTIFGLTAALYIWCSESLQKCYMKPCPLCDADVVVLKIGEDEHICPVEPASAGELGSPAHFHFHCFRYTWSEEHGRFRPGGQLELTGPQIQDTLKLKGLSHAAASQKLIKEGPNTIHLEVPGIWASLKEEFRCKMYVYQACCIWVLLFNTLWNIGYVWLILVLTSGIVKALLITRPNRLQTKALAANKSDSLVQVLREGVRSSISSESLVTGDLVLIQSGMTMPCDCVLARGSVIMNESMLTGEPMPITKVEAEADASSIRKVSMVLSGTQVLDTGGHDHGTALAVVQAVGGTCQKADLIRLVVFPSATNSQFDVDLPKSYALLVGYACCLLLTMIKFGGGDLTVNFSRALMNVLQCINPLLGVAIAAGHSIGVTHLREKGITCLLPERVSSAGGIDTIVLDKTGTITQADMDMHGVQVCENGAVGRLYLKNCNFTSDGKMEHGMLPRELRYLMASCNNLSLVNGDLVGNHVETEMFKALPFWSLRIADSIRTVTNTSQKLSSEKLSVLRVLDFDHERTTSGCICELPDGQKRVFIKGAVSKLMQLCRDAPEDLVSVSDDWSARSYYVLGCGVKDLGDLSIDATRDELEQGLQASGLLIFKNELKPDSKAAVAEMHAGGLTTLICTGDHLLTGISVAQETCIISEGEQVIRLESASETGAMVAFEDMTGNALSYTSVTENQVFVADVAAWKALRSSPLLHSVLPKLRVVARMKPADKVDLIKELIAIGRYVGMCGDGGNDCGALRTAHIGVALSTADASIVAAFSSGVNMSLYSLVDVLKEGRACMSTCIACYCYYISYALTVTGAKMTMFFRNGSVMAEWQFIFFDIFLSVLLPWSMTHSRAAPVLALHRPNRSLFDARVVLQCVGSHILFLVALPLALFVMFSHDDFYVNWDSLVLGFPQHEFNKMADTFETEVCFLLLVFHLATCGLVYSFGSVHRRPFWCNTRLLCVYTIAITLIAAMALTQSNVISCLFRVNCDSASSLSLSIPIVDQFTVWGLGHCFMGPQMMRWKDHAPADQSGVIVADMVKEATTGDAFTCVPSEATMKAQDVPSQYSKASDINNIMSVEYRVFLVLLCLAEISLMCFFHGHVLTRSFFDTRENKEDDTAGPARQRRMKLPADEDVELSQISVESTAAVARPEQPGCGTS